MATLSVKVRYRQYLPTLREYITPFDEGATVLLFPDVNILTSEYDLQGESLTDRRSTIRYLQKGTASEFGDVVFRAVPYGTHTIATLSKNNPGKTSVVSINVDSPEESLSVLIPD